MKAKLKKLVCVVLVLGCLLNLCACSYIDKLQSQFSIINSSISSEEVVRLLVCAINDSSQEADSYAAIPEGQRKNVSFSYFKEYVDILRDMSSVHGQVTSFRILDNIDSGILINDMLAQNGNSLENVTDGGVIQAVQLFYANSNEETDEPVYFYITRQDDGTVYLDSSWITQTIAIYNYVDHYFSMLDEENTRGIYTLLRPALTQSYYTDEVINARAEALSSYYLLKVKGASSSFILQSINPFEAVIIQPEVISEDNLTVTERTVTVNMLQDGVFVINDPIPQTGNMSLLNLSVEDDWVFRCGSSYSSEYVYDNFRTPTAVYVEPDVIDTRTDSYGNTQECHRVIVTYTGILFIFEGYFDNDGSWTGELVTLRILENCDTNDSIAGGITVGSSVCDILLKYPFIDEYDYTIYYSLEGVEYEVQFVIQNGFVASIRVAEI